MKFQVWAPQIEALWVNYESKQAITKIGILRYEQKLAGGVGDTNNYSYKNVPTQQKYTFQIEFCKVYLAYASSGFLLLLPALMLSFVQSI